MDSSNNPPQEGGGSSPSSNTGSQQGRQDRPRGPPNRTVSLNSRAASMRRYSGAGRTDLSPGRGRVVGRGSPPSSTANRAPAPRAAFASTGRRFASEMRVGASSAASAAAIMAGGMSRSVNEEDDHSPPPNRSASMSMAKWTNRSTSTGFIASTFLDDSERDKFSSFKNKTATVSLGDLPPTEKTPNTSILGDRSFTSASAASSAALPPRFQKHHETTAAEYFAKKREESEVDQSVNFMDHKTANYEVEGESQDDASFLPDILFQKHKPKRGFQRRNPSGPMVQNQQNRQNSFRDIYLSTRDLGASFSRGMSFRIDKKKGKLETFKEEEEPVRKATSKKSNNSDTAEDIFYFAGRIMFWTLFFAVILCAVTYASFKETTPSVLRGSATAVLQEDHSRHSQFEEHLYDNGMHGVKDESSPSHKALEWLVKEDEAKVEIDHPHLMERFIMALLYYTFEGSEWTGRRNWLSRQSVCTWYGVTCSPAAEGSKVLELDLSHNGLARAPLPMEIHALTHLTSLDLSYNLLSGSLPKKFFDFHSLKYVTLHHNALIGTLHDHIGQMQSLESLLLGHNRLEGTLPPTISSLIHLKSLSLTNNTFHGSIPDQLSSLKHLENLHLGYNQFDGKLPASVANPALQELHVQENQLSGNIPEEFGSMRGIRSIHMNDNMLGGPIPDIFNHLGDLVELHLENNKLALTLPESIGQLSNLRTLFLGDNDFTGTIPNWEHLEKLEHFTANDANLEGPIPVTMGQWTNLKEVRLNGNALEGTIPIELGLLVQLEECRLEQNRLTGHVPNELGSLSKLSTLTIQLNDVTGSVPHAVCNLQSKASLAYMAADCESDDIKCSCCTKCY